MFSRDVMESTKLIDFIFIAGVNFDKLSLSGHTNLNVLNEFSKPELLFSFPENKEFIFNSILDVSKYYLSR
jgi:hypothetical protein